MSRDYVLGLEKRVAWLESLLIRVKRANLSDVDAILAEVNFDEPLNQQAGENTVLTDSDVTSMVFRRPYLQIESAGSLLYHGPTSIYHFSTVPARNDNRRSVSGLPRADMAHNSRISLVAQHFGINMQEELVTNALLEFFKWQYPHFMFIYREAFLRDHFAEDEDRKYWSASLLFAVCALGLLMRTAQDERDASERFFSAAESILLVSGLAHPCITTVQAFLCLAYYEIGRGNLSKSWGFSGMFTAIVLGHQMLVLATAHPTFSQELHYGWRKILASREILIIGYRLISHLLRGKTGKFAAVSTGDAIFPISLLVSFWDGPYFSMMTMQRSSQ